MDNKERIQMIEWLIELATKYNLGQCTVHQAIMVLDKYLSLKITIVENIKEIILMSLYLSSKLEEVSVTDLAEISENIFPDQKNNEKMVKLYKTEMDILEKLKYKIYYDTIYQYINTYHSSNKIISSNYFLSCGLATILLTKLDYQSVPVDILAEKIINFTNLLEMNDTLIETTVNADILYIYIYLSWKEHVNSRHTAINQFYLQRRKCDISTISIPKINCIYQMDTFSIRDHWNQTWMEISHTFYDYPKKLFDIRVDIKRMGTPGSFGSVKKVKMNNKYIALKKIKCDEQEDGFYCYMLRELNILFRLHHQNITNIDGFYYDTERMILYIGMDLMDKTLCEQIKNNISGTLKFSYIKQFLSGLKYIHSQNIMHRDLSTNNVLVSDDGSLKISDFGISRYFRHKDFCSKYTNLVCTLYYRPIEILLGEDVYSYKMDIWSCACVICYILLGADIFPGDSEIDTIFKIFRVLGTPSKEDYPYLYSLPNFRLNFPQWKRTGITNLDSTYPKQTTILYKMFDYSEEQRLDASEALNMFIDSFVEK